MMSCTKYGKLNLLDDVVQWMLYNKLNKKGHINQVIYRSEELHTKQNENNTQTYSTTLANLIVVILIFLDTRGIFRRYSNDGHLRERSLSSSKSKFSFSAGLIFATP